MAKPYMPLMVGDWLKGTRGMRADAKGVYLGLLLHQHEEGFIPNDLEQLALIEPEVGKVWVFIKDKFEEFEPGKLRNNKLVEVLAFWEKQGKNGSKGGRPKKENPNDNPKPNPNSNPKGNHHNDHDHDNDLAIELKKGGAGENRQEIADDMLEDYIEWTEQVIAKNDQHFEQMLMKERINANGQLTTLARDHLGLLSRYPKMRPANQQRFRFSLLNHIRENLNKSHSHESVKRTPATAITEAPAGGFGKL